MEVHLDGIESALSTVSEETAKFHELLKTLDGQMFPRPAREKVKANEKPWRLPPAQPKASPTKPPQKRSPVRAKPPPRPEPDIVLSPPIASPRPVSDSRIPLPSPSRNSSDPMAHATPQKSVPEKVDDVPDAGFTTPVKATTPPAESTAGSRSPAPLRLNPTVIPRKKKMTLARLGTPILANIMSTLLFHEREAVAQTCRSLFVAAVTCTRNELVLLETYRSPSVEENAHRRVSEKRELCDRLLAWQEGLSGDAQNNQ